MSRYTGDADKRYGTELAGIQKHLLHLVFPALEAIRVFLCFLSFSRDRYFD